MIAKKCVKLGLAVPYLRILRTRLLTECECAILLGDGQWNIAKPRVPLGKVCFGDRTASIPSLHLRHLGQQLGVYHYSDGLSSW